MTLKFAYEENGNCRVVYSRKVEEMKAITYKGHKIVKTSIVCLSQKNRALYEISGKFGKSATTSPLLTSRAACREYLTSLLGLPYVIAGL